MKIKQLKNASTSQVEKKRIKISDIDDYKLNSSLNEYQTKPLKPKIFLKKAKVSTRIIPFDKPGELHGLIRHFPPAAQEWVNSIYSYNSNYNKLLTIADKNLMTLVNSFVNIKYKRTQKKKNIKKALISKIHLNKYRVRKYSYNHWLKKKYSANKTFVAKGNIKHTSNAAIITIFIYKKAENVGLIKTFKRMRFLIFKGNFGRNSEPRLWVKNLKYRNRKLHRKLHKKYVKFDKDFEKFCSMQSKSGATAPNNILSVEEQKIIYLCKHYTRPVKHTRNNKPIRFIKDPTLYFQKKGSVEAVSNWKAKIYIKLVFKLNKWMKNFLLNEKKYQKIFLENFRKLACKIYNKNVIFNFVKLSKFYLNSNIYTQIVTLKLKKRELGLSVLGNSLQNINLPKLPAKLKAKINKKDLRINIIYHRDIFDLVSARKRKTAKSLWLEFLLFKYNRIVNPFSLFGRMKLAHRKIQILRANKKWLAKKQMRRLLNNFKVKLKDIKYKGLAGIRIESRGRLTKRFKASRSVYKLKWIGGLRNIDSSYKGLSAVMLRGHGLSNVEYTMLSSKRPIGAYGVKGWVSSL